MHLQAQPRGPPTAEVLAVLGLTLLDVVARLLLLLPKPARRRAAPGGGNGPRHTRQQQKHDQQVNRSRATGYGSSSAHFTRVGGRVRTASQTRLGNGKEFRALVKRAFCGSFPATNQPRRLLDGASAKSRGPPAVPRLVGKNANERGCPIARATGHPRVSPFSGRPILSRARGGTGTCPLALVNQL